MSGFVRGPVAASVPATSANLGPGFDAFGLALDLHDRLEAEVLAEPGLRVEVDGEGSGAVPLDERHLVVRSMRAAFAVLGVEPPGLRLRCTNVIPHARGLGSSSAAIVGGLALARALVTDGAARLTDVALFALAADLEGHPDNVAPACFGGFVIAGREAEGAGGWFAVPVAVAHDVAAVVFVPPTGVETARARGLLPAQVPHADAAANAGRAALLVAALGTGDVGDLLRATEDRLHQAYRRPAMPDTLDLVTRLRADGVPAVVSGAGPTVLAFVSRAAGPRAHDEVLARVPEGWTARVLGLEPHGVEAGATT